jgi:GrpB-like predicted nucleotidyltransferase (UPF0157 family)
MLPTIDIDRLIKNMASIGYIHVKSASENVFLKGYTAKGFCGQAFHVHVRYPGDWDELYFRDYLRQHTEIAEEYGKLKTILKKKFEFDRDSYSAAKTNFIRSITRLAKSEMRVK